MELYIEIRKLLPQYSKNNSKFGPKEIVETPKLTFMSQYFYINEEAPEIRQKYLK